MTDRLVCTPRTPSASHPPCGVGGSREKGESMKSQRIALALAMLAALDAAVAERGWHATSRLRALTARMVAEALA